MNKYIAKLVTFGKGGDTVYIGANHTISGYGNPERPHAADSQKDTLEIPDGTFAIDKRPAVETEEGFAWVFKGPMINVDLVESETDKHAFSYVTINDYVEGWKNHGAKIGTYLKGQIVWA